MPFANLSFLVDPGNSTRTQPDAGTQWGRSLRFVDTGDWQYARLCVGGQVTSPADGTVVGGVQYSPDNQVTWLPLISPTFLLNASGAQVVVGAWALVDPAAVALGSCWIRSQYQTFGAGGAGNASASVVVALQFLDLQFR